jgi:hypothetical protein
VTRDSLARVAAYYAPELDDPLWAAGCAWLGRDPETGAAPAQPSVPGLAAITADARLYGFHATLKAPMRLATDWDALLVDAERLAGRLAPFVLPSLRVANLSGFLALRETAPSPALQALADACTEALDVHRAPPLPEELARRRTGGLAPEEQAMLQRWGYPSAFATWRFHMTLSCRLDDAERERVGAAAAAWFEAALAASRQVTSLCLFTQVGPGAPFMLAERLPLRG